MAERLRIPRFNSQAEFQAWWSGAEVNEFLKRHPDKLDALSEHPWVKPYLGEVKTPPVADKNQDKSSRQFGKYQIEKKLGQGGMGAVYLAYDPSLERRVALKVMILKEEDAVQRFMVEAKASARLKHPNILPVYEIGTVGKYHYFTMEYIDGVPLSDLIQDKSKSLNAKQIAGVIKDISSALSYAHSQGVLHRDIKPANIMIDKKGTPYLTDFGLAKEMSRIDRSLTISGTIVGTPDYMSPEQARGLKD
ncbi:MAG TPA: serine/threonine-protein kinase, partial [Planctomycetota bacterium]|nr:serine/threonine-protein kinase [Planctomycetota bacterium]